MKKYKVGDWVEYKIGMMLYQGQISEIDGDLIVIDPTHDWNGEERQGLYSANITRKIAPSEVVIHIGCLSGTVEKAHGEYKGTFILRGLSGQRNVLWLSMLDTPTRKLVESLLKAQNKGDII